MKKYQKAIKNHPFQKKTNPVKAVDIKTKTQTILIILNKSFISLLYHNKFKKERTPRMIS